MAAAHASALPARPGEATLPERVRREHLASIYFNYDATVFARCVFILVIGAFLYTQLDHGRDLVLPYVGLHLVLCLYLYRAPRWTPKEPASRNDHWNRRVVLSCVALGGLDALAPWLFVPEGKLPVTSVMMVILMANCARAVQSLRALKPALFGNVLPTMLSLIAALALHGDGLHLFLASFGCVYLAMMLRVGLEEHRQLTDALLLRFENEEMAGQLRRQIAATERASAEKTRFLATASHDLRQPLHAIALFGAALENALRDRPEGRSAERLMHAVNALGTSLDTMLDVSRLDAGVVIAEPRALPLDSLFLPINHMFSAPAENKQLQLRVRASGLWVRSDPQLLHRMLSNLVDNALKYSTRGGVAVVARARNDQVWVDVCDTGIGIAPEQVERIFEEFYQVGNPGRDRAHGLGIGLSIVQRLSRLLGHPVQVSSRVGRGSRFRIVLPRSRPPVGAPSAALPTRRLPQSAPRLAGRVLLVDDEAQIREAMAALLMSLDVELVAVADGTTAEIALSRALRENTPFDLIISDYRLGGDADGLALGLRLRARYGSMDRPLPLLLITGETSAEKLQRVRASGVPVLFKPVHSAALLRAMGELMARAPANA